MHRKHIHTYPRTPFYRLVPRVFQLTGQIKSQVAEKIEVVKQHSGEDGSLLGHVR